MKKFRPVEKELVEQSIAAHLCRCWQITRRHDAKTISITDHDRVVEASQFGAIFHPSPGIKASATRYESGLRESSSGLSGTVIDGTDVHSVTGRPLHGITLGELRADLWKNAVVSAIILDWRYPWLDPYRRDLFFVADIDFDEYEWSFDLRGLTSILRRKRGEYFTKGCLNAFGDSTCNRTGKTPTAPGTAVHRYQGIVGGVDPDRRRFRVVSATLSPATPENLFAFGFIQHTGTSSDNNRLRRPVESSTAGAGSSPSAYVDVALAEPFPFNVILGDTVDLIVGCDGSPVTCKDTFDNYENFRAHPFVPGYDSMVSTPGAS